MSIKRKEKYQTQMFCLLFVYIFIFTLIILYIYCWRKIYLFYNEYKFEYLNKGNSIHFIDEIKNENNDEKQSQKEYEYIEQKTQIINGNLSNISHDQYYDKKEKGKDLISSVYDVKDKCQIKDFTNNHKDTEEHFQGDLYERVNKNHLKSNDKFQLRPDHFKVYLINMKNSVERLNRFLDTYNASDLSLAEFERVEGINGKQLDITKYVSKDAYNSIKNAEKLGHRKYHYELTRGAVGCYLSHVEVFKRVCQQTKEYAFIFEDDVKFNTLNMLEDVNNYINTVPQNWDILLLGCVCFICGKYMTYYDINRYFLMHGYIIKKSSAKKILNLIKNEKIEQQIDAHFSELVDRRLLKIYCLRDNLASQWDMGTNIQLPVKNIEGINPFTSLYQIE